MSASSSRFTVACPGCGERLRFELPLDGPARVRVQCAACRTQFGVRRPGVAPISSSPAAGAAEATGAPAAGGSSAAGDTAPLIGTPTAAPVGVTAARPPVFAAGELVAARYRVVRFLAQGGMGEVYEVEDLELREAVALKTVRPEAAADSMAVERFRREIQLARKVTHPNVCRIFDVYYHRPAGGGGPAVIFLTMELLVGETLATRLRCDGPLPAGEALAIARQICLGLDAAHQVGVIHRDLKPGNIVLVPGRGGWRAVVTDFGLARLDGGNDPAAPTLTVAGGLVGTPAYLAPEQVEGGEITTAVDIYALGIVLYEMATGTVPFVGDSVLATAVKRLKELPVSPRVHAPHLDPRWEAAILRCLARDPADRFASALDVLAALTAPEAGAAAALPAAAEGTASRALAGVAPAGPAGGGPSLPGGAAATAASLRPSLDRSAVSAAAPASIGDGARQPIGADGAVVPSAPGGAVVAAERRRSGRRLAALAALVLVALAVGWYRYTTWRRAKAAAEAGIAPGGEVTPRRSVAVLGFRDLSGAAGTAWLSPAFAEMLTTELGAGGGLRVIGGEEVARAKLELQLGQPDSLARDTLGRIRTLLGSDAVVLGSYLVVGAGSAAQVRLDVRMQDALTGETATFAETGPQADLLKLVSHAGDRLRDQLHAAGAAAPVHAAAVANPEAARLYAEGMQKLRLFDPVGARDLLAQAVAADPASALAHSGLAAAWATLGFDDKAVAEAKTAFELSSGLPAEDRLVIEGRYREATGELGTAVDIYRRLLSLTPDNLDYGLTVGGGERRGGT
jgi:tRNA A-37 threonylcarbamoyl transferase component Bud32/TolB-like protein